MNLIAFFAKILSVLNINYPLLIFFLIIKVAVLKQVLSHNSKSRTDFRPYMREPWYTRTKICHSFVTFYNTSFRLLSFWKPWCIFVFATSAWVVVRLHTWTKIWRTFLLHSKFYKFTSLQSLY